MTQNRHMKRSLAREPTRAAVAHAPSWAKVAMGLIALLAVALQSFVVQTHIHMRQGSGGIQTMSIVTAARHIATVAPVAEDSQAATPRDKYPINEDPSNCPLCQEIAHSGPFVHSAVVLVALPSSVAAPFILFSEALPSFFAVSHNWRGRAPPARSTAS